MERFISLLSFLTRIPVKTSETLDEEFHKSAKYFPLVGIVLGIFYVGFSYLGNMIFGPVIGGIIFIIMNIVLTGGLHLDGLGDTFDGLYSYREKNKILEIMKDSRLGTNALLAILILIMFKVALASELLSQGFYFAIFLMPVVGKLSSVFACYVGKTAKETGMCNAFIGKIIKSDFYIAILTVIVLLVAVFLLTSSFIFFILNIIVISLVLIATIAYLHHVYSIIDGLTGDVLGAICELSELLYLFLISLGVVLWQLFI